MPGFNIESGSDSENKNNKAETNRKHRWRFTTGFLQPNEWIYLKSAARPNFKLESPEMHHNEEVAYFAGKRSWEPISVEFYDIISPRVISQRLYDWVAAGTTNSVTDVSNSTTAAPTDYKVEVTLDMLDGQGTTTETWKLFGCWPSESNWNEISYDDTEIATIAMTLKFDRATKIA